MNNKELTAVMAQLMGCSVKEVAEWMAAFGTVMSARLMDNDTISLAGLGQFEVRKKEERVSVNPTNGKRYLVPPKLVPVFKPGSTLKNRLKAQGEAEHE